MAICVWMKGSVKNPYREANFPFKNKDNKETPRIFSGPPLQILICGTQDFMNIPLRCKTLWGKDTNPEKTGKEQPGRRARRQFAKSRDAQDPAPGNHIITCEIFDVFCGNKLHAWI